MEKISKKEIQKKCATHKFFKIFDKEDKNYLNISEIMNVIEEIYSMMNYNFEPIEAIKEKIIKFFFCFFV